MIASLSGTLAGLLIAATIVGFVLAYQFQKLAFAAKAETVKANDARTHETLARRDLERLLVDNYTENGLGATRLKDHRQAVLWFAHAAVLAKHYPLRREHNLVRFASWLTQSAVPSYAFNAAGYFCEALRFHPSGKYLLVESLAWECEIHDLESHSKLTLPNSNSIHTAQWSPDGKLLALASKNTLSLFDFPKLSPVRQWSHPDTICCMTFNNKGNRLAVGSDKGFRVYDIADPMSAPPMTELGSRVHAIQFNNEATHLAVATDDKRLRAYAMSTNVAVDQQSLPTQELATEGGEVLFGFVAGDRLAMVDNNRAIRCWDLKQSAIAWEKPVGRVICMDVSQDGRRIAYESLDVSYKHWAQALDAATGEPTGTRVTHRNHIYSLDWNPDGKTLLATSGDHSVSITDMDSGKSVVALVPHNGFVLRGTWSPDGQTFATVHWSDRLVRVWRLPKPATQDFLTTGENEQGFFKLTPDGRTMFAAGFDTLRMQQEIRIRDVQTGQGIGAVIRPTGAINDAAFLPSHNLLVTGGSVDVRPDRKLVTSQPFDSKGSIQFWNPVTGQTVHSPLSTATEPVAVAGDPSESSIAVLCDNGQLQLVDAKTGLVRWDVQAYQRPFADKGWVIRDRLRFSPDGSRLAVWGFGGEVQLRGTAKGELQRSVHHHGDQVLIHDVRFVPNGKELVTCSSDNTLLGWDVATGNQIAKLQHTGWVFNAQFNSGGTRLLTASSDRQGRLWDWQTKTLLTSTFEQDDQVYGVAFGPNDSIFVTGTRDGMITAWESTTGKQVAPTRQVNGMVYQVQIEPKTGMLLASGRLKGIAGTPVNEWLKSPEVQLPADDLLMLAEIVANQKILDTSVAANLTSEEWFTRWNSFRSKYPTHPIFRVQNKTPVGKQVP